MEITKAPIAEVRNYLYKSPYAPQFRGHVNMGLYMDAWANMGLFCWQKRDPKKPLPFRDATEGAIWKPTTWKADVENLNEASLRAEGLNNATELLFLGNISAASKLGFIGKLRRMNSFPEVIEEPKTDEIPLASTENMDVPERLGDFLRIYLAERHLSQKELAGNLGLSQAVISNTITEARPVRDAIPRILEAIDVDEDLRTQLMEKYLNDKQKEEIDFAGSKGLVGTITHLAMPQLRKFGYECIETFLLQIYLNATRRLVPIVAAIDQMDDNTSIEEFKTGIASVDTKPDYFAMKKDQGYSTLLLNAWAARGLFAHTVFENRREEEKTDA
jgi:transcriptional regulator with XRE-family HTH domain